MYLPEDNAPATVNMLYVAHWRPDSVDRTRSDWLQRLAVVCDKYGCAEHMRFYFNSIMKDAPDTMCVYDEAIIYAVIGDENEFSQRSSCFVIDKKADVVDSIHKDLLDLLPEGCLGELRKCPPGTRIDVCR